MKKSTVKKQLVVVKLFCQSPKHTERIAALHGHCDALPKVGRRSGLMRHCTDSSTDFLHQAGSLLAPDTGSLNGKRHKVDASYDVGVFLRLQQLRRRCRRSSLSTAGLQMRGGVCVWTGGVPSSSPPRHLCDAVCVWSLYACHCWCTVRVVHVLPVFLC
jgi:hypothetical protein